MYMQKVLEVMGEAISTRDALVSYYKEEVERLQKEVDKLKEAAIWGQKGADKE